MLFLSYQVITSHACRNTEACPLSCHLSTSSVLKDRPLQRFYLPKLTEVSEELGGCLSLRHLEKRIGSVMEKARDSFPASAWKRLLRKLLLDGSLLPSNRSVVWRAARWREGRTARHGRRAGAWCSTGPTLMLGSRRVDRAQTCHVWKGRLLLP